MKLILKLIVLAAVVYLICYFVSGTSHLSWHPIARVFVVIMYFIVAIGVTKHHYDD